MRADAAPRLCGTGSGGLWQWALAAAAYGLALDAEYQWRPNSTARWICTTCAPAAPTWCAGADRQTRAARALKHSGRAGFPTVVPATFASSGIGREALRDNGFA